MDATPAPRTTDDGIASAPGDLPLPLIAERVAAQRTQFRHDNITISLAPAPGEPVEVWATSGEDLPLAAAAVYYTRDGSLPDLAAARTPLEAARVEWDARTGFLTYWRATLPPSPVGSVVRYRLGGYRRTTRLPNPESDVPDVWAHDGQGLWFRVVDETGVSTFAYSVEAPGDGLPAWVRDAVIYHLFLDRFHPGTPDGTFTTSDDPRAIHGGTLHGVLQALPYLEDLGVTCLWLSPLYASPSYHRYDTTDYATVDPALGTNDDLRTLTNAAHALGMRVVMDFVPAHCSAEHPAFRAARQDPTAPTATWFTFEERPDRYRTFLGLTPFLPSLNTEDPGARRHLIGCATAWLRDYGVDGFRLDHAIGSGMDFWVEFRRAMRAVAPDALTIGEVTDSPDCLRRYHHRLDTVLDFPLARALRLTFGSGSWTLGEFDTFLDSYERFMAGGPDTISFLDNHDMNRFLFLAGGETARVKLAALCQFTLRAVPAIYYGTEIALAQEQDMTTIPFGGDAEVRRDMPWQRAGWDTDLLSFYRALTRLRRAHPALHRGGRHTVHLDAPGGTYAYVRSLPNASSDRPGAMLIVLNLARDERTITLPPASPGHAYTCLLSTNTETMPSVSREGRITLGPTAGVALGVASV